MEELKVTPSELKELISCGKMVGKGFFSATFEYKDRLIKLDRTLYELIKANDIIFARKMLEYHYQFRQRNFNEPEQIEKLVTKQKDITLTKLPTGIVTLDGVGEKFKDIVPGIIIPYHKDHQDLELLKKGEYKQILMVLKKLLLAVKELADNEIAQEDLSRYEYRPPYKAFYNVLYKDDTPQIIDMSGDFIKVDDAFIDASRMYRQLGNIFIDFFNYKNIPSLYQKEEVDSYSKNKDLLKDFADKTRGK